MEFAYIILEKEDKIATITLNRPPMNPISIELVKEINSAIDNIKDDPLIRSVIITGAGDRAFAAGADVNVFKGENPERMRELARVGQRLSREIEDLGLPVIAAINGFALGGGVELAMACDLRIASENAKFGQPEINLGLIPGWGGCVRLPRLIGPTKAMELIMMGDMINAEQAQSLGLINMIVPQEELLSATKEFAKKLGTKPRIALQQAKNVIKKGIEMSKDSALNLEAESFALLFSTEDAQEGIKAFLEKRKPNFKD
jgi:enoyl-CoA hydratase